MTRSLDNLFDEPQRSSEPGSSKPVGGDFDTLLDADQVETKGAIDPSWDQVRAAVPAKAQLDVPGGPTASEPSSALEDEGLDDLMGMTGSKSRSKTTLQRADFPPEPSLTGGVGGQNDGEASFPWWVIVAAILLILAGAAAVVTFS